MPRIISKLPNMSAEVSGVAFAEDVEREPGARPEWISEEVSAETADRFASIPGYRVAELGDDAGKGGDGNDAGDAPDDKPRRGRQAKKED